MELKGSLPCSREPATVPYPEPHESSPGVNLFKIHFNIIITSNYCNTQEICFIMLKEPHPLCY